MANKILKQLSPQIPFQAEFRFLTPCRLKDPGGLNFYLQMKKMIRR